MKSSNPYVKVWDSVEDHEAEVILWMRSGTLFEPTREELARRHVSHAKNLLLKARQLGGNDGRAVFKDAMFHRNRAEDLFRQHAEVIRKSR